MDANATIKARVDMGAVKIHGPNSPHVLAGIVEVGHKEIVEVTDAEQVIELTYEQAVDMFGEDRAKELFGRDG